MGQQRHFDRVCGLVSGQSGTPEAEITLETRLVEDLGIDGDDGDELLQAFAHEFGVDMSSMDPLNYFGDERTGLPAPSLVPLASFLIPGFRASVRHATRGRRALSVRSLVASARARHWLTPEQRPTRELDKTNEFYWLVLGIVLVFTAWVCMRCLEYGILAAALVPALVCAALGVRYLRDLALLQRLDAAASFEE
jgi:acyl carrier protein